MKNLFQQEESYFPEDITRGKYDSLGWNKYTYVPNIYAINCLIYIYDFTKYIGFQYFFE